MMDTRTRSPQRIADKTDDEQQTLYFTLSLYADREQMHGIFGKRLTPLLDPERQLDIQADYRASLELRDAIEPLFNDITDRERESRIEDFLLSTPNGLRVEKLTITIPSRIEWTTEGVRFVADLGSEVTKDLHMRTFWYVHANGALSYHMSFICRYEHTARDFYFLSMLQKACAPKEFKGRPHRRGGADRGGESAASLGGDTGVFPLDNVRVSSDHAPQIADMAFWDYVRNRFNAHARDLFCHESVGVAAPERDDYFADLIAHDGFIEVPGLKMPRARYMFLFHDRTFFRALDREERKNVGDIGAMRDVYDEMKMRIAAAKRNHLADPQTSATVTLDRDFLTDIEQDDRALQYYFLSGFCQNIIDFLNQDASEIRDSLDPIYPATPEQEEEKFFFRFANPRSMVQFVEQSRSLNIGNDYIGTCPYAFLIHVASLHNEFLAHAFERDVAQLRRDVDRETRDNNDYKKAASLFYDFRTKTLENHIRYRYENVFRYDTESDCFAGLEKVRGIMRKQTYLREIVNNLESATRDLEQRQRQQEADQRAFEGEQRELEAEKREEDNRWLNILVAAIGFASILQVWLQIAEATEKKSGFLRDVAHMGLIPAIQQWHPEMAIILLLISLLLLILGLGGALALLYRERRDIANMCLGWRKRRAARRQNKAS